MNEMKWREDKNSSKIELDGLRIIVHNYVGCGEDLFLSCYDININQKPLNTTNLDIAKQIAIGIVRDKITKWYNEIEKLESK